MTNPKAAPSNSNKKKGPTNPKKATNNAKKAQQQPKTKKPANTPSLAQLPPIESPDDYPSLLETARSLTPQESAEELLECARYGESDAIRAILEVHSEFINTADSGGNTALHKAAANGHVSTVSLLLVKGAKHTQNENGATPLHWAAGAGKSTVCKLLLDHFDALSNKSDEGEVKMLDVLLKNSFGRSALTEAFTSGDTETVGVLLNHDSAEEDKLIGGIKTEEVDAVDADEKEAKQTKEEIVHEFDFRRGLDEQPDSEEERQSVLIRELPIAHPDNPFGQSAVEDTTGLSIWCASLIMARWLASQPMSSRLTNKHILELGAGCAVPSFSAMAYASPASVTISDLNPDTIENIEHNIELNTNSKCEAKACTIDWADETTYPEQKMDYVICSDCIYQKEIVPLLKKVVMGTLKNPTSESDENSSHRPSFLYVAPEGGRDGLPEFISMMKSHGFQCVKEEIAPDVYRENPLKSGDEEDCFLHFHELASTTYVLYEFQWR